jgi:hypothetical protein
MDRRLSELPNDISTQTCIILVAAIFMVKVDRPEIKREKQLNCLRKVRPVNKGLRHASIFSVLFGQGGLHCQVCVSKYLGTV